ncbi:MAG: hypothetical protein WC894_01825 [Patescibacteria group bacterium]
MNERSGFNLKLFDEQKLSPYLPNSYHSPDGANQMSKFYPECYLDAKRTAIQLNNLGFLFKKAGISVAVEPYDVAITNALLSNILNPNPDPGSNPNMMTTIPHFFLSLSPTKTKNLLPAYCARSIISPLSNRFGVPNDPGSIILEQGASVNINFIDEPPYCIYPKNAEKNTLPAHIILNEIRAKLKDINWKVADLNVGILAGIGKNTQETTNKIFSENNESKIENVLHGSTVVNLARIAISLLDWGMKNSGKSLFFISTTRLTNDNDSTPPQAYLLNKLFKQLGWNPEWLGMPIVRAGAERTHPTGAMLVEIKPSEYHETLNMLQLQFNKAVEKMTLANPNLF